MHFGAQRFQLKDAQAIGLSRIGFVEILQLELSLKMIACLINILFEIDDV
jgi:hypothetical protein